MPEGKSAELLYVLAQFSDGGRVPVPLRGLEDAMSIMGFYGNSSDFSFPALLIDDKWYSREMLDEIVHLRDWGYIRIDQHNNKHRISLKVSAEDAIEKLRGQVKIAEYRGLLSELGKWAIADDLHGLVVELLKSGDRNLKSRLSVLSEKTGPEAISGKYSALLNVLRAQEP